MESEKSKKDEVKPIQYIKGDVQQFSLCVEFLGIFAHIPVIIRRILTYIKDVENFCACRIYSKI